MSLLLSLFPGLADHDGEFVPFWPRDSEPWSVLIGNDGGLISQISELAEDEKRIIIHPSAKIGDNVCIEGPCFIGKDVEIRHSAYLRKGSWICEGGMVGHSTEVKNSLFLPGAKAPHFNYVGDSILGFSVNIGAGVKLSNVRNDRGLIRAPMEDGSFLETGLRKFGALVGDGSQIGCNSVSNPGSIIPPGSMVNPNETITGWLN